MSGSNNNPYSSNNNNNRSQGFSNYHANNNNNNNHRRKLPNSNDVNNDLNNGVNNGQHNSAFADPPSFNQSQQYPPTQQNPYQQQQQQQQQSTNYYQAQQQYQSLHQQPQQLPSPPKRDKNPPPAPQNNNSNGNQQQQQHQQATIDALRKQLEDKDEENFDLSATLSAVQVETTHTIGQVELESKQTISKLEEALRRAQQDANRARSALKKQQQHQPLPPPPFNQQQPPPAIAIHHQHQQQQQQHAQQQQRQDPAVPAANIPFLNPRDQRANRNNNNARNSNVIHGSQSPRSSSKTKSAPPPPAADEAPMDVEVGAAANTGGGNSSMMMVTNGTATSSAFASCELARRLLQTMPLTVVASTNAQHHQEQVDQVRQFLTQKMTTRDNNNNNDDTNNNGIVWGLVHFGLDYGNHPALGVLQRALLWSPQACRALVQAAGLGRSLDEDESPMMMTTDVDDETLRVAGSTIRFLPVALQRKEEQQQHRHHLEAIAASFKQPLALSSSFSMNRLPPAPSTIDTPSFSHKQQALARQLITKLSEAILPQPSISISGNKNATELVALSILPYSDSIRILAHLVSSIYHPQQHASNEDNLLEPAMIKIVARLEAHRRQSVKLRMMTLQPGGKLPESVRRAYKSLQQKQQEPLDDENEDDDQVMMMLDESAAKTNGGMETEKGTKTTTTNGSNNRSKKSKEEYFDNVPELDPMLIEVCRQLGSILPDAGEQNHNHERKTKTKSGEKISGLWRKAVLANACDMLEDDLLPLLLKLGSQPPAAKQNGNEKLCVATFAASPTVLAAWQQWVPYLTGLVSCSSGRQLLRVKYPLEIFKAAYSAMDGPSSDDAVVVIPNATAPGSLSCSALGVVVQLLYASVMVEQFQARRVPPAILELCRTLRDQSIRFLHAWLQSHEARQQHQLSFLELVSEFVEYYKSACTWILHSNNSSRGAGGISTVDPVILAMIRSQMKELAEDEEEAKEELEEHYRRKK